MEPAEKVPDELSAVREALRSWYLDHHRPLPWRDTTDPYPILVAEVMSQQTQLDRVIDPFEAFIERWPTIAALADAEQADVVAFWSDNALGYNSRARYLCEAADHVVESFDGRIPTEPEQLEELPGVGPYTANAVASFAFNSGNAVVDTNVKRVLYRAFAIPDDADQFEATANELLPPNDSRTWNNAIMELGGTVCNTSPRCDAEPCPWRRWCKAYRSGDFTAPDVPSQPTFTGSRRQYRGRIVRALSSQDAIPISQLGRKIRIDYGSDGADRTWLMNLLGDLEDDGLVTTATVDGTVVARLAE